MVASRTASLCLLALVASYGVSQDTATLKQADAVAPPKVDLTEISTIPVKGLPAESIEAHFSCDSDGRIFLRLAMPDTGTEDPISVSRDGKTLVRFGKEKIYDIPQPSLQNLFLVDRDVYILGRGRMPLGHDTKWRMPSGEVESQPAYKATSFVAHFDKDGRYAGAVQLDVPFHPQQFGVFGNGDFLVSGMERIGEARVAIVGSNGQLRRFVDLKGDIRLDEGADNLERNSTTPPPSGRSATSEDSSDNSYSRDAFFKIVSTSRIVQFGSNLLLFRAANGPVYSVSPSGEVNAQRLKVEGNDRLFMVKPTRNVWIVEFTRDLPNGGGREFATFAFDPESGQPVREFFFPRDLGWGLACVDGDRFTFVTANENTRAIELVTLGPR